MIRILLHVENKLIRFRVENSLHPSQTGINQSGSGIGLKNVTRRLELLYPGRHRLMIRNTDQTFSVDLEIDVP
jgi:LytS/YehU family sensor histidine kinase